METLESVVAGEAERPHQTSGVVPAKAGTHPQAVVWRRPAMTGWAQTSSCGYGSRPSPGRQ